jgi:alpha-maltose-1-phosphate synthase
VVVNSETGILVPIDQVQDGSGTPLDPDRFVEDLALALTGLVRQPALAAALGRAGRERAVAEFSWSSIAGKTVEIYRSVVPPPPSVVPA